MSLKQSRSAAAVFSFALNSSSAFHAANPWFDNRKLAAYANVSDLAPHPEIYRVFGAKANRSLEKWRPPSCDFVLKADSGHSAKWVWPFRATGRGTWTDQVRQKDFDAEAIRELARLSVTRTRCKTVFAEALIRRSGRPAPDYKFYVSGGSCVLLLIVRRTPDGAQLKYFDRELSPIVLTELFAADDAVEWEDVDLADGALIRSMMDVAEQLAQRHCAPFCRYDFLVGDASFFFGEVSPVCGAMLYLEPTDLAASILLPKTSIDVDYSAKAKFLDRIRVQARTWIEANAAQGLAANDAYWQFIDATDSSPVDLGFEDFLEIAEQGSLAWLETPPEADAGLARTAAGQKLTPRKRGLGAQEG
jgi:hypothetical protein